MVLAGIVGAIAIISLLFFSKQGPEAVASEFMHALAKGDVDRLVELSYYSSGSKEQLRRKWEFSTQVAGKHLPFTFKIKHTKIADERTASVNMDYIKNTRDPSAYEEAYSLPMVKENGRWLVDVASISRTMYPALPK